MKVGVAVTGRKGLVVGARSFAGNPYDGDTLAEQLEQVGDRQRHAADDGGCAAAI